MRQLRKFEQDAIVNTIADKVNTQRKIKARQLVSKRDYLSFQKQIEAIEKLQEKESEIYKKHKKLKDKLRTHIKSFNFNNQVNLVLGYHNQLEFREADYSLRNDISDKLAIALLEKDSTDRLPQIIKEISKESV
tara:strand:- start:149 stop:550 length:402 start_codon:yes stop_codon:yes gene_type:complete